MWYTSLVSLYIIKLSVSSEVIIPLCHDPYLIIIVILFVMLADSVIYRGVSDMRFYDVLDKICVKKVNNGSCKM